jgi:hypothetical protein
MEVSEVKKGEKHTAAAKQLEGTEGHKVVIPPPQLIEGIEQRGDRDLPRYSSPATRLTGKSANTVKRSTRN